MLTLSYLERLKSSQPIAFSFRKPAGDNKRAVAGFAVCPLSTVVRLVELSQEKALLEPLLAFDL